MVKKFTSLLLILGLSFSLVSCNSKKNQENTENKNTTLIETESNTTKPKDTNTAVEKKDKITPNKNTNSPSKTAKNNIAKNKVSNSTMKKSSPKKQYKKHLTILSEIKTKAKTGGIINSKFKAGVNVIDNVTKSLGKASSSNYVNNAKGTYYTFNKYNVAFGCNKGGSIFESRSFDNRLATLHLKDIVNTYGKPHYTILTKNKERIIGYKINNKYKTLFVFKQGNENNPRLSHYSVLYPEGTANSMSNSPARKW